MRHLTLAELIELHRRVIQQSGGATGIRDLGLAESALAQPQMSFGGKDLYPTLAEKAAALCYSLVMNHAFVDGNKRIGHAAMETFLAMNGYELDAHIDDSESGICAYPPYPYYPWPCLGSDFNWATDQTDDTDFPRVPRREKLQLGRRVSGVGPGPLTGQDQGRDGLEHDHVAPGLGAYSDGGCSHQSKSKECLEAGVIGLRAMWYTQTVLTERAATRWGICTVLPSRVHIEGEGIDAPRHKYSYRLADASRVGHKAVIHFGMPQRFAARS